MANSVTIKLGYTGTDFTREYKFTDVSASALSSVKTRILEINNVLTNTPESVSARKLTDNFVADSYVIGGTSGKMKAIVDATIVTEQITKIPLF